ncbi:MAG: Ketosteroid isomerase-related protein [Geminicoccaceae bacterium]|jgi:ketosteroid isomerase-like protein|nr:Ketosteroid isomerase-related protein [Geminicoccaceae bacterium]
MSQENVEVVRRAVEFEFSGRGDRAEAEAIFDPGFVMNPLEEGPSYGLDAIRDNIAHWRTAWDQLEVTAEEFIDAGDRVVVTLHHRGRGRGSGVEIDARFYELYTLRGGKVLRADEYAERADALEAAGLSE